MALVTIDLAALFDSKTSTCLNCAGDIFWHPSARRWLHTETRITICDHNSSTPTTAVPQEEDE